MDFYNFCLTECVNNENYILYEILIEEAAPSDEEALNVYTYDFLNWLNRNLGYYHISADQFHYQKKFIKYLITSFENFI